MAVVDNARPTLEQFSASQASANGIDQSFAMALSLELEAEKQSCLQLR